MVYSGFFTSLGSFLRCLLLGGWDYCWPSKSEEWQEWYTHSRLTFPWDGARMRNQATLFVVPLQPRGVTDGTVRLVDWVMLQTWTTLYSTHCQCALVYVVSLLLDGRHKFWHKPSEKAKPMTDSRFPDLLVLLFFEYQPKTPILKRGKQVCMLHSQLRNDSNDVFLQMATHPVNSITSSRSLACKARRVDSGCLRDKIENCTVSIHFKTTC